MAMNSEVKAEWVKALRSGEYPQTNGLLLRPDIDGNGTPGYCCLGVLCELAAKAAVTNRYPDGSYGTDENDLSAIDLPESVQRWSGLIDEKLADMDAINDLIGYNDDGKPFAYIADVIEARL